MPKWLKILLAVVAVCVVLAVAGVIGGVMFIRSHMDREVMNPQAASARLDLVRQRFKGAIPVIELRDEGPRLTRAVPDQPATTHLKTVHILQWNPENAALARFDLPFMFLRFRDQPIQIGSTLVPGLRVNRPFMINGEQLERFGPALLFDQDMHDGTHLIIWSE